jgi:hypothetical protein
MNINNDSTMNIKKSKMSSRPTKKKKSAEMLSTLAGSLQARAEAEVGVTSVARLDWLLRLLNRSQEGIGVGSEQERIDLEAQVVAFAKPVGRASGGRQSQLNWKEAWDLVRSLRASILGLMAGASFQVEIRNLVYLVTPGEPLIYMGVPGMIFRIAVAKLMETEQQRIKICARPRCGKLFVRHKRGLYCSPQCSQLEQLKRYVDRHSRATTKR